MLELFLSVLGAVFHWQSILVMMVGITAGMVIGALPGLSANMGVALLIPVTFAMEPAMGLLMLVSLYTSAIYGGSVTAILLNTPGTSASAATAIDGYELTKQGKADQAIRIATFSSVIGGLISALVLLFLTPPLSRISLLFGPPEYFFLAVFGLTAIASVSSGSLTKGFISGAFGLLLGTIGMDLASGFPRFTFGVFQLHSGISIVPTMIGLFAMSQVLSLSEKKPKEVPATTTLNKMQFIPSLEEIKEIKNTIMRSSVIGIIIGMLPGAGANIASWISYSQSKSWSKNPQKYGKGSIEGISASETANNAATGSSLIPLLTLGIPGSATAAVLLGALMIQGLIPGRELFTTHGRLTYTVLIGFVIANILMGVMAILVVRFMTRITKVPRGIIIPMVVTLCVLGSYAVGNNIFDVYIMFIFGMVGYLMKKFNFSPAAALLGLILGPIAEKGFRQTVVLGGDSIISYIFTRPLTLVLIILIIMAIIISIISEGKSKASK